LHCHLCGNEIPKFLRNAFLGRAYSSLPLRNTLCAQGP
jgi:hypothetical protein